MVAEVGYGCGFFGGRFWRLSRLTTEGEHAEHRAQPTVYGAASDQHGSSRGEDPAASGSRVRLCVKRGNLDSGVGERTSREVCVLRASRVQVG